nr:regulator of nonsense transcripts 1 like [Quercus suber]
MPQCVDSNIKGTDIYNDRRLFFGGGPGVVLMILLVLLPHFQMLIEEAVVVGMPVQGPSQTFRDGFSMAGMSQNSWVMTPKARDHMFLIMLLNFPLRLLKVDMLSIMLLGARGGFPGNFLNQNSQAGYSRFGIGNDFISQVGFNDPSQDDASQSHFGVANGNPLQSQVSSTFNVVY